MLNNYLKVAIRSLLRDKTSSVINILGLAIGLACCILILQFVAYEWTYDSFHEKQDRLFRLITAKKSPDGSISCVALQPVPLREVLVQEFPEIVNAVNFIANPRSIVRYGDRTFAETIWYSEAPVLQMFSFPLLAGDPATALQSPRAIVISQTTAQKYFGNEDPLGKFLSIRISEENYEHVVTGVMVDIPENSSIEFDLLVPMTGYPWYDSPHFSDQWGSSRMLVYVELAESTSAAQLQAKFPAIVDKFLGSRIQQSQNEGSLSADQDAWQIMLQPLRDVHLSDDVKWSMRPAGNPNYGYVLLAIAALVLTIACINFMTLAIARSAGRAREVGMRKVLGAARAQLMKQFWTEALLLTLVALMLGIGLAELFLPVFNDLVGKKLSLDLAVSGYSWFGIAGLLLLTAIIAGSYPALVLSGFQPTRVLKSTPASGMTPAGGFAGHFRKSLVVVQFTFSILFIVCTLVMNDQMRFIRARDLGFNHQAVVAIRCYSRDVESAQVVERFRNALQPYPQVLSVSAGTHSFNRGWSRQSWNVDGKLLEAYEFRVDHEYLHTLELQLAEGRFFSPEFPSDVKNAVVVNETLVREFGLESPVVGKPLRGWGPNVVGSTDDPIIIGVVKDYNFGSLREAIQPAVLHLTPDWPLIYVLARISPRNVTTTLELLKNTWQTASPNTPFDYSFVDEDIARWYLEDQRRNEIVGYASLFAILIACMGLLGLALLHVGQRTKEIGIRKVLGASVVAVTGLVSREFVKLILFAMLVAWPLAWYVMSLWLQEFAYRINIGWWAFIAAGGSTLVLALLTVGTQAMRAALANPVEALRYE